MNLIKLINKKEYEVINYKNHGSFYMHHHVMPRETSQFFPEMGESEMPPSMAEGIFSLVTTPCNVAGHDFNRA
jgi:hypothetical protein